MVRIGPVLSHDQVREDGHRDIELATLRDRDVELAALLEEGLESLEDVRQPERTVPRAQRGVLSPLLQARRTGVPRRAWTEDQGLDDLGPGDPYDGDVSPSTARSLATRHPPTFASMQMPTCMPARAFCKTRTRPCARVYSQTHVRCK